MKTKMYAIEFAALILAIASITAVSPACVAQHAAGTLKPLTAQQAINTHGISDLHFSPDGTHVAMTVSEPVKAHLA